MSATVCFYEMKVSGKLQVVMHKGDGSGAASSFSEAVRPLTYISCLDPEEAFPVLLASIAPVTVMALDGNDHVLRLCEMVAQALDGVWRSAYRQTMYAHLFRAVHHTRGHPGVVQPGCRCGREG